MKSIDWIVAYDISCRLRRYRIARILEGYGERIQESLFALHVSPAEVRHVKARVAGLLKDSEDSIRFYPLCGECAGQSHELLADSLRTVPRMPREPLFFMA